MSKQVSAFKDLYTQVLLNGGDVSKLPSSIVNKTIKCYVKESKKFFLVTDDFFYVPAYFTQKAYNDFKSKFPNMNLTDLETKVLLISEWSLELVRVNSSEIFTSYGGIEIRLIVKSFKPQISDAAPIVLNRTPVNLYRDDEIKTLIQNYTYDSVSSAVKSGLKSESLPDVSKKAEISAGIVSFSSGATFSGWSFKDGKTAILPIGSILKLEKGDAAVKKEGSAVKAKVVGGKNAKPKGGAKKVADIKLAAKKLADLAPAGKPKKSVGKVLGAQPLPSPGEGRSGAGTTNNQTMAEFKRMVEFIKQKKAIGKKSQGKVSIPHKKISKK